MKALLYSLCAVALAALAASNITSQDMPVSDSYNLVYATGDSSISDEIRSLVSQLNGIVIYSADELAVYQQLFSIDTLWFDASSLGYLDADFVRDLYTNGVFITAFNVDSSELATVLDTPFLADRYTLVEDEIVYVTLHQITLQPTLTPIVPYGQQMFPVMNAQQSSSRNSVGSLSQPDELQALLNLSQDIAQFREFKRDFFQEFQQSLRSD